MNREQAAEILGKLIRYSDDDLSNSVHWEDKNGKEIAYAYCDLDSRVVVVDGEVFQDPDAQLLVNLGKSRYDSELL